MINKIISRKRATANSTFAIGGVSCSADSFVVPESFVLRINTCGKNPALRKHFSVISHFNDNQRQKTYRN